MGKESVVEILDGHEDEPKTPSIVWIILPQEELGNWISGGSEREETHSAGDGIFDLSLVEHGLSLLSLEVTRIDEEAFPDVF